MNLRIQLPCKKKQKEGSSGGWVLSWALIFKGYLQCKSAAGNKVSQLVCSCHIEFSCLRSKAFPDSSVQWHRELWGTLCEREGEKFKGAGGEWKLTAVTGTAATTSAVNSCKEEEENRPVFSGKMKATVKDINWGQVEAKPQTYLKFFQIHMHLILTGHKHGSPLDKRHFTC